MQSYTPLLSISTRAVNLSLDTCKEIEVVVNAGGARKLRALEVDSRVPNAAALSPLLVPFSAGKRTCACLAAGASIFAEVVVAIWSWVSYDHENMIRRGGRDVVTIFCRGLLVRARPWRHVLPPCEKVSICNSRYVNELV